MPSATTASPDVSGSPSESSVGEVEGAGSISDHIFLLLSTVILLMTIHTHTHIYNIIIFFAGYPFCVRHNVMRKYFLSKK